MITIEEASTLLGRPLVGRNGQRIGEVESVFLDEQTGKPEWATVTTGRRGPQETFVPLAEAQVDGSTLRVPYAEDRVVGAPTVDADQELSQEAEERLYAHYGMAHAERSSQSGLPDPTSTSTVGTTSATTGTTAAVTRPQEQLLVGTQRVEAGRARLRKHVTTEHESAQVRVAHDELRVSREPVDATNYDAAMDGPEMTEAVHEVVLDAERPVVDTEVVPVERVRLGTETVTGTEAVGGQVRTEEVELIDQRGRRTDVDSDPTA